MNRVPSSNPAIRPALPDEASYLTELTIRSKAHWGYSVDFMAAAQSDLIVTREQLERERAFVIELEGVVAGYYKLREVTTEQIELTDLFVDPLAMGQGCGRLLWEHAVATARQAGYSLMTWESDPNAEGFYLRMGGIRVGEVESSVWPGRMMPRLQLRL